MARTISLPEGFLSSLAEMTVRSVPAEVLDARLEAGLVCVICGRSVLRLAWTPPPRASRWGELHLAVIQLLHFPQSSLMT